ncbi:hypothetical protein QYF36_019232 [Acer negundo]|nr:hypothetical protein QYF36_019232 [Acer negundo]
MANTASRLHNYLFYALLVAAAFVPNCFGHERKVHVVYMGERPPGDISVHSTHHYSMLKNVLGRPQDPEVIVNSVIAIVDDKSLVNCSSTSAKDSLIYSYGRSFNGFAAKLTDEEVARFSEMEGVISVIPNHILKLHTTRSWDFMGFSKGKIGASQEGNVIIGLLDTGIWPESESFNDQGLSSPPSKWKGICQGVNFTCNNKIIGARYYNSEKYYDPTDFPSPRDSEGHGTHTSSTAADILAAFDDAIADGVDIISVSLGTDEGLSINSFNIIGTSFPLIWGGDAANYSAGADSEIASYCFTGAMNSYKVAGKIVLCETLYDGSGILMANGLGTIMADSSITDFAFSYPLPATLITAEDGVEILDYIRTTQNPIATILAGDTWKDVMAPSVVSFSSRGPNPITPDILKPDLTAPGVDILAAWSPVSPPSIYYDDTRSVNFNIISGTSMSCPHASAAAAYVKAAHPNWSPAAIKSALMTTAYVIDPRKHIDLEFAYGAGHINPAQAIDPGLVYDAYVGDYINFLCEQGYNSTTLRMVTGDNSSDCQNTLPGRAWDLNYPSFSVAVEDGQQIQAVFTRTVTNVGSPNSTYTLSMYMPSSVSVVIEPSVLSFSNIGEQKSFIVKVYGPQIMQQPIMSGAIIWDDGVHKVRSPLVIYSILPGFASSSFSTPKKNLQFNGPSMYTKNGIIGRN